MMMNLDRFLSVVTSLAWGLFAAILMALFIYLVIQQGLKGALKQLISVKLLPPLLILIGLTILSASVVFIQPQEIGVVISLISPEGFRDQPIRSGLHLVVPLAEEVVTYPIYWQTYTMSRKPTEGQEIGDDSIVARTSDGQEVSIDCSVIFRVDPVQVVWLHIDWQDRYVQDLIRPVTRGIVRTQVSQYKVDEVNSSKRLDLEAELNRRMREALEGQGLVLDRFVLRNIAFSPEYAAAVERKQVALEGVTQKQYEANQLRNLAEGEADRVKTLAQAQAEAIAIKAQAEANARLIRAQAETKALQAISIALAQNPNLLTYQYINKLSPAIKVMLVPNNAPYILPLPNLNFTQTQTSTLPSTIATGTLTGTLVFTPTITP